MSYKLNLVGGVYGRLTVTAYAGVVRSGTTWVCHCECGSTVVVRGNALRTGNTKSCGCLSRALTSSLNRTHGASRTRTYRIWKAMWTRCTNERLIGAKHYVLRGITVDARWSEYPAFLADMGEAPHKGSIDRVSNDKGYSPENCRWVTYRQQARNSRGRSGGAKGVHWVPRLSKWRAVICSGKARWHLGVFDLLADALAARKAGEAKHWKT